MLSLITLEAIQTIRNTLRRARISKKVTLQFSLVILLEKVNKIFHMARGCLKNAEKVSGIIKWPFNRLNVQKIEKLTEQLNSMHEVSYLTYDSHCDKSQGTHLGSSGNRHL